MLTTIRRKLWQARTRYRLLNGVWETIRGRKYPIFLEFPIHPRPRYGYGEHPPHRAIEALLRTGDSVYEAHLRYFLTLEESFSAIPIEGAAGDITTPAWNNGSLPALDAMALYGFLTKLDPETYLEVGYGNSTRFARRAIEDQGLRTKMVAIDPYVKDGCDEQCDRIIHQAMEDVDPTLFSSLKSGDILFIDGSHWVFQNSDVVVFFLDILPALPPGIWVHIHDITLPVDYGPDFVERYWSEQYMLAAFLLGGGVGIEVQLPNHYLWKNSTLVSVLEPLRDRLPGVPLVGSSFWFRTVERERGGDPALTG